MGGSRSKRVTIGHKYFISLHYVISLGPIDSMVAMYVDTDNLVWSGQAGVAKELNDLGFNTYLDSSNLSIRALRVFGENAGGYEGEGELFKGELSSEKAEEVYSKIGNLPDFRGVTSLFFKNLYSGNSPYLKSPEFVISRTQTSSDYSGLVWRRDLANVNQYIWGKETQGHYYYFALDASGSMLEVVGNATRFQNMKIAVNHALDQIKDNMESGIDVSVLVLGWSAGVDAYIKKESMDLADLEEVRSFVNGLGTSVGTYFPSAFAQARDFLAGGYSSFKQNFKGFVFFMTDGEPAVIPPVLTPQQIVDLTQEEVALLNYIRHEVMRDPLYRIGSIYGLFDTFLADIVVYGVGIDDVGTGYIADSISPARNNQVLSIDSSNADALKDIIKSSLFSQGITHDMNPVHIIRECLVNKEWGASIPENLIDNQNFSSCAEVLRNERFGLSMSWKQQGEILDFVKNVLAHINGVLIEDKETGKFSLKLIRDDYDKSTALKLNETNVAVVENFSSTNIGDLVTQVIVTYNDVVRGKQATAVAHNTALQMVQGNTNIHKVDYNGITRGPLAAKVAERDLRATSVPLVSCSIVCTTEASHITKGDVVQLTWPKFDVYGAYLRVLSVNYGDGLSNTVTLECIQDVFSTPEIPSVVEEEQHWEPASTKAHSAKYRRFWEPTFFELTRSLDKSTMMAYVYPATTFSTWIVPKGEEYIWATVTRAEGLDSGEVLDTKPSLIYEVVELGSDLQWNDVEVTRSHFVGDLTKGALFLVNDEIIQITDYQGDNIKLARGLFDTVPSYHSEGGLLYNLDDSTIFEEEEYDAGTSELFYLQMATSNDISLEMDSAEVAFKGKAYRPLPPANLRFFDSEDYRIYNLGGQIGRYVWIYWENRNRLQQTAEGEQLSWFEGSVTLEEHVTTIITLKAPGKESLEIFNSRDKEFLFDIQDYPEYSEEIFVHLEIKTYNIEEDLDSLETLMLDVGLGATSLTPFIFTNTIPAGNLRVEYTP